MGVDAAIVLKPMGMVDATVVNKLLEPIRTAFGREVRIGQALPEPTYAENIQLRFIPGSGTDHVQFLVTAMLNELKRSRTREEERTLGVTEQDLFIPELNFVFGMADPDGGVAIISLTRLRPEFYGQAPNEDLLLERAVKEALHELGHTFGLQHCDNPDCVMHFSQTIKDTDKKRAWFCGGCRG
jgi:archaemetzincin